jgi:hypothetical protein
VSANERGFTVMVRNAMFRRVELVALHRYEELGELHSAQGWRADRWAEAMVGYWDEYNDLGIGAPARAAGLVMINRGADSWSVRQTFDDPAGDRDWGITAEVQLAASDEAGEPVITVTAVGPLTG